MKTCAILANNPAEYEAYLDYFCRTTGYKLSNWPSVKEYVKRWPFRPNTFILVGWGKLGWGNPLLIGHTQEETTLRHCKAEVVTIEEWTKLWLEEQTRLPAPLPTFPEPAKYSITYQTSKGAIKNYEISLPIEANKEQIIAYAFGRGIRTFKKDRISRLQQVG